MTKEESNQQTIDRGIALAEVLKAVPAMIYAAMLVLLFGFIGMAIWFNHKSMETFTGQVLTWLARLLILAGAVMLLAGAWKAYQLYHVAHLHIYERRTARAAADRQRQLVRKVELQNEQLAVKIELERQLPAVIKYALEQGHNITYNKDGLSVENYLSNLHALQAGSTQASNAPALPPATLPTNVLYEDIRGQIPQGHILVGIGAQGVETKEKAVGACVWIVGLSGTGKTSTTVLRVEERHADGHQFIGVDPHWFKPDSLMNAIGAYADDFLRPIARTPEEAAEVFKFFIDEFNARKAGRVPKPWQKLTLLVDEVGALMDPTTRQEEENAKLLPTIARICGQEARNFEMGGIFISQQATSLAWLRKMALMVIVHQLLMESEKLLACNGDKNAVEDMKTWPIGRTYVFGVGFQDGPRTVQQPYFSAPAGSTQWNYKVEIEGSIETEQDAEQDAEQDTDPLPLDEDLREALEAWCGGATGPRAMQRAIGCTYYQAQKLCAALVEKGLVESD